MREEVVRRILSTKLIAIVRGIAGESCMALAEALCESGVEMIEFTFDQKNPLGNEEVADTINNIRVRFGDKLLPGAGTVTTPDLVDLAGRAGALYIISPDMNPAVIEHTRERGLVSIPGALSPTEILSAHRAGADFVKIFPASVLGTEYIKAIRAPINHVKLLAVGGINAENIGDFLSAGVVGAGVGGNLVSKKLVAEGRFAEIREYAGTLVKNAAAGTKQNS
ncbi:MAG: bifunctional 4-hydroxy-2-oxoglutarate aldolase/2-dehydro-3-deoxy-phosphogluconate aldolase [Synergistaceae bacterium]|jgi:2-dehydro-3-deoxyphosphogluconate aldolase/(4S)-4-hydroxy-2-oxoglutarate aldolase|nr:bifunctional 4-hydroxy-2-oxoglutarate aldolase/2-dehydro-3-deoxy-phosphogluconate aldolase [Synergistaceae bacterium]